MCQCVAVVLEKNQSSISSSILPFQFLRRAKEDNCRNINIIFKPLILSQDRIAWRGTEGFAYRNRRVGQKDK